jgi:hypothetical protein
MERQVGVSAVAVIAALLIGGRVLGHSGRDPRRSERLLMIQVVAAGALDERDRLRERAHLA